jgi:hypothetical protein
VQRSIATTGKKGEGKTTREERGVRLFRERGEEIAHVRGPVYLAPSEGVDGYFYAVDLGAGSCECPDRVRPCKHVFAVGIFRAKSAPCAECRKRFPRREMVEVGPELAACGFDVEEGERYCDDCAFERGVL